MRNSTSVFRIVIFNVYVALAIFFTPVDLQAGRDDTIQFLPIWQRPVKFKLAAYKDNLFRFVGHLWSVDFQLSGDQHKKVVSLRVLMNASFRTNCAFDVLINNSQITDLSRHIAQREISYFGGDKDKGELLFQHTIQIPVGHLKESSNVLTFAKTDSMTDCHAPVLYEVILSFSPKEPEVVRRYVKSN